MQHWPINFDFETDATCQSIFKPFIERQMKNLEKFHALRDKNATYIFHEHAARVAGDVYKTCLHLNLGETVANNMRWAVLPHDIGKILLPPDIWDVGDKPDERLKKLRRTHTILGAQIVNEELAGANHPFKDLMLDIMVNHHEQMDGGGYLGLKSDQLSMPVRLAAIVEAFDGWSIPRPHFGERDVSPDAVLNRMRTEKAGMFDRELFEKFAEFKLSLSLQGEGGDPRASGGKPGEGLRF
jgi:HD-GYP domain-containing protein (c-di-GMP phosphodiesterase class II)